MPKFQYGDIVEAEIADPNGENRKPRPVIVLTPTNEIDEDGSLVVAAVSSSLIPEELPESQFELPFHPDGRCATGLRRRCVAKCEWLAQVAHKDVLRKRGRVPAAILKAIAEYIAKQDAE